jgi:hypothetical protein
MEKISKELLSNSIIECLEAEESLAGHEEQQFYENYIEIPFYVIGLLTEMGRIEFEGHIIVFDDGYYIASDIGHTSAISAIPELRSFIEALNALLPYGDVNIDYDKGMVLFRTYERFWDEHEFNSGIFYEAIQTHINAHKYYKEPIYLLIKGASSASTQISKLKDLDII